MFQNVSLNNLHFCCRSLDDGDGQPPSQHLSDIRKLPLSPVSEKNAESSKDSESLCSPRGYFDPYVHGIIRYRNHWNIYFCACQSSNQ